MTTAVSINKSGLIYSGSYECEGHNVSFIILTGDKVKIIEVNTAAGKTGSSDRTEFLDQAIEYQERLIRSGYDKVS
mgnify:CR=1 FL=1|jgi:hypothetical protein|tara:strand:+ start:289 stop:516 length:228 start_codon:yes stop_codon:yes gene_type:complete